MSHLIKIYAVCKFGSGALSAETKITEFANCVNLD